MSALTLDYDGSSAPTIWNESRRPVSGVSKAIMSDSRPSDCPFCRLPPWRILVENAHAVAIADAFPVSPGHALVILRRHSACFFELTLVEITAVHEFLHQMKVRLNK